MTVGLSHILVVSVICSPLESLAFGPTEYSRLLMSIELLFNSVGLNFVAFNRYHHPDMVWGQAATLFVIALAAAEAVVVLLWC